MERTNRTTEKVDAVARGESMEALEPSQPVLDSITSTLSVAIVPSRSTLSHYAARFRETIGRCFRPARWLDRQVGAEEALRGLP